MRRANANVRRSLAQEDWMIMRGFVVSAVVGVVGMFGVGVAEADTASVNFGTCFHAVGTTGDTSLVSAQAPGRSSNGPLTIVSTPSGNAITASGGFAGGVGCAR
jgi:hypothetical protein